jgi:hypothetical protein
LKVCFALENAVVEIGLSDRDLATGVAKLFPEARLDDPSEDMPDRLEVGSNDEGFYFRIEDAVTVFDSVPDLMAAVEFAIANELLEQHGSFTHMHAAGAWTPHGAVIVTGAAGAGKSSCALAWSMAGLPLFGDDLIRVDSAGLVAVFPRLMKVHPDRLAEFGFAAADTLFWDADHGEAWFDPEEEGGWVDQKSRAAIVAQIEYDGGDNVRLTEVDEAEGLRILLDSVQSAGLPKETSVDGLIKLLRGTRVLRVRYGSSREMASRLVQVAAEGAPSFENGRRGS